MPAKVQHHAAHVNTPNRVFLEPPHLSSQKYTHKKRLLLFQEAASLRQQVYIYRQENVDLFKGYLRL